MNITIQQSNQLTERDIPASLISYFYNQGKDSGIALSGAIEITEGVFKNQLDAIREWYPDLYITASKVYIPFADSEVQRVLVANNFSSDGVGLTQNDVQTITSIGTIFQGNKNITTFNEFEQFVNVTNIQASAFSGCTRLASVTIPNSVIRMKGAAFKNCSSLTFIAIPNNVTSIETRAFEGCSGLTSVHISDLVAWCNIAFNDSFSNPLYYARNLYLGDEEITDLVIPNSVTSIGNYAFRNCSGLTSVTIPNSVTSIGHQAFYGCRGLTSVTIPNSVTSIGENAFYQCSGLTSVTIPNGVTSIGSSAFNSCSNITSVNIPSSVVSIYGYAFMSCSKLTQVDITDLESWCTINFSNFSSNPLYYAHHLYLNGTEITNLTIPNSLTTLKNYTFYGCSGLTSVTIENDITSIGKGAFYECSNLAQITINATTPPTVNADTFLSTNNCPIYVPAQSVASYQTADGWSTYASRIQAIPSNP